MATPIEGSIITGVSLAAMFGAAPFGVPVETIALGTCFAVVGVLGRAAFELQNVAEGRKDGMMLGSILRWVGAGLIGAPFMAVMVIVAMKMMGWQIDNKSVFGFLGLGFLGPKGLSWFSTMVADEIRRRLGIPRENPNEKRL